MKTILSVVAWWVLFVFIHVEAVTDGDYQSVLARLNALEEKQAFSEQRIAALETENKLSQKRIADLEKYKTLSDRRVAALERRTALNDRSNDALAFVKELYAQKVALETETILSDKATTNGYDNSLSDGKIASPVKDKLFSDSKVATLEDGYEVPPNRTGNDDSHTAEVETTNQATAVLRSEHRKLFAGGAVAFSAVKTAQQQHMGINQNIMFEQVLTNEGSGYHPNLGVFIAPLPGVYVFSSTIMTYDNTEEYTEIALNGNTVAKIYGHGSGRHDQGSQTVVIRLNAGDEVAVRNTKTDGSVWGSLFSTFSGCLVWL